MNIENYTKALSDLLGLAGNETQDDIFARIRAEGWEPELFSEVVGGQTLWACPIRKGIFRTVERDESSGRMGQAGSPTPQIAVLEALRKARFKPRLQELWEYVSQHNLTEKELSYAAQEVMQVAAEASTIQGAIPLVITGSAPPGSVTPRYGEFMKWLSEFVKGLNPKSPSDRYALLKMIGVLLTWAVANLSTCQRQSPEVVINNFFNTPFSGF